MISDALQKLIEKQINENIDQNIMFTAFDLTKTLRTLVNNISDGAGEFIGHNDIRQFLNDNAFIYENRGYTRTLVTLDVDNKPEAFVYHDVHLDAEDYCLALKDKNDDNISDDKKISNGKHVLTKEGRLNISPSILKKVGVSSNCSACIGKNNDKLIISQVYFPGASNLVVNKDGRIRLSRYSLNKFGITGNSFSIEVENDSVVISEK